MSKDCYICFEPTSSKSPCICQAVLCENCYQIEKTRTNHCSICRTPFHSDNTINETFNKLFDPFSSPRRLPIPENLNQNITTERPRSPRNPLIVPCKIAFSVPVFFVLCLLFGNTVMHYINTTCCDITFNAQIWSYGSLVTLFLQMLYDCIYFKPPSSFSRLDDEHNLELGNLPSRNH